MKQPSNQSAKQANDNKARQNKKLVTLAELKTAVENMIKDYLETGDTNVAISSFKDLRAPRK